VIRRFQLPPIVPDWAWLPGSPAASVRDQILGILNEQKPGSVLEWVKVLRARVLDGRKARAG
jgi:hypothetical protein